ncbi:hypothetical protein SEA_NICEHOUSE_279 [Rhodococcus phage NiceHouse]|nr:hypothetical protein SEA_NICEHOUSE_279 [Rhodococcus phage NiceHouse]
MDEGYQFFAVLPDGDPDWLVFDTADNLDHADYVEFPKSLHDKFIASPEYDEYISRVYWYAD